MSTEVISLSAHGRALTGKKVKQLRAKGMVPGVVYGHGLESHAVSVDERTFAKVLAQAGESTLVDLQLDGAAPVKVLIQDVQQHPLSGVTIHIDFRQVKMSEKLEADIALHFVGEAPAVKALGGILVRNLTSMKVRCLPQYLVHTIEVPLTGLGAFGSAIKVKDIPMPEGMEFLARPEEIVVVVNEPISEADLAALDAKPEADVTQVKTAADEKKAKEDATAVEEEKAKE